MSQTVLNGHEHIDLHRQQDGRDCIRLVTTSGEQFPDKGLSEDHVTIVTVFGAEVDTASLMLEGIRNRTGQIPLNGREECFAAAACGLAE